MKVRNFKGALLLIPLILALFVSILSGCSDDPLDGPYSNCWETGAFEGGQREDTSAQTNEDGTYTTKEDGIYTSKEEVAAYIHEHGTLPVNFITKKEAKALGWKGGSLEKYAPGKCIGGDYFGNYEKKLPKAKGRKYYECDIDTLGKRSRGAKRIIYSSDGLIFYTSDHYATFTQLYK